MVSSRLAPRKRRRAGSHHFWRPLFPTVRKTKRPAPCDAGRCVLLEAVRLLDLDLHRAGVGSEIECVAGLLVLRIDDALLLRLDVGGRAEFVAVQPPGAGYRHAE